MSVFLVLISEKIEDEESLRNNTLKIADLGLAREVPKTTQMTIAGTHAWMSPEIIAKGMCSKYE